MKMRSLISALMATAMFGAGGCTLYEKVKIDIIYAPQFHSKFDITQSPVLIRSAHLFIYNSKDSLIRDTLLTTKELSSADPLLIVKGIVAGAYRMVAYYNADQMTIDGHSVGSSVIGDLKLSLVPSLGRGIDSVVVDSLCYSFVPFDVQRGDPTILTTKIESAHYLTTVKVTGLDRPTVRVGKIGVELLGLPSSLDAMMNISNRYNHIVDLTEQSYGQCSGECLTLKYLTQHRVQLRVTEDGVSIQTLDLQPELYFAVGAASNRLNIEVQFYANSYSIAVNDWKLGQFEIINIGG